MPAACRGRQQPSRQGLSPAADPTAQSATRRTVSCNLPELITLAAGEGSSKCASSSRVRQYPNRIRQPALPGLSCRMRGRGACGTPIPHSSCAQTVSLCTSPSHEYQDPASSCRLRQPTPTSVGPYPSCWPSRCPSPGACSSQRVGVVRSTRHANAPMRNGDRSAVGCCISS